MSKSARRAQDRMATARPHRRGASDRNRQRLILCRARAFHLALTPQAESENDCAWLLLRAHLKLHRSQRLACAHRQIVRPSTRNIHTDSRARRERACLAGVVVRSISRKLIATEA